MPLVKMPDGAVVDMPENPTAEQSAALQKLLAGPSVNPLAEGAKVLGSSVYGGVTSLPRFVKEAGDWLERKMPTPEWSKTPIPGADAIGQADTAIRSALQPETEAGKTAARIGEAGIGAIAGPGGLAAPVKSGLIGLSAGGGSELAAKAFGDNAITRLLGGLAGGGAMAIGQAVRPNAENMLKTATRGMSDADWKKAQVLEATLNAQGLPHLKSQLLGPNSSVADLVQQASANPQVRPSLLQATSGVVPKTEEALNVWMSGTLPVAAAERRGLMQDVQNVAKQADVAGVRRANAAYEAAMPEAGGVYKGDYIANLRQTLIDLANSERFGPASAGGKAILRFANTKLPREVPGTPATAGSLVDDFGKPLTITPAVPAATPSMPKEHLNNLIKDLNVLSMQEGWKGLPVGDLKAVLKSYTPEFEAARAAKSAVMSSDVNPMRQGLAGQINRMGGGTDVGKYTAGDIVKLVFPADKAQPAAIGKLAQDIGADQVGMLLREHLTSSWQHVSKGLHGREGAPADFVAAIAGNSSMKSNLNAGLDAAAKAQGLNPGAVRNGFYELTNALGTYKDLKLSTGVGGATTAFEAGKSIAGMAVAPQSRLGRYLWERASAKTYQKIADMVTSADGLAQLERIARTPDPKLKAALVRGVIAGAVESGGNTPDVTTE